MSWIQNDEHYFRRHHGTQRVDYTYSYHVSIMKCLYSFHSLRKAIHLTSTAADPAFDRCVGYTFIRSSDPIHFSRKQLYNKWVGKDMVRL